MNSIKIIKHLKKLSKTETKMPIDLSETKIYWANKLATKLKKDKDFYYCTLCNNALYLLKPHRVLVTIL